MTPNPEEAQALESIRLVQEAVSTSTSKSTSMSTSSRTPSPSSPLPPSYLPLLKITPYSKETPEWESPTSVKVTDIVAHFEYLHKTKDHHHLNLEDGGSGSSRNESRSSGIFSDFDEDHTDLQPWANLSRSSTPLRNLGNDGATPTTTPKPVPRTLSFSKPSPPCAGRQADKPLGVGEFGNDSDSVGEVEKNAIDQDQEGVNFDVDFYPKIGPEPEVDVEEMNNNDHNHTHTSRYNAYGADAAADATGNGTRSGSLFAKLLRKLSSLLIFAYLLLTGCAGAFLLGLQTSPRYLDYLKFLQGQGVTLVENILPNLQKLVELSPTSFLNEGLPLLLATGVTLQFLGWYFIFRKHFWRQKSVSGLSGFLSNFLLALFQPGLFLISSSSEPEMVSDTDDFGEEEGQIENETQYSAQPPDSGFLEENSEESGLKLVEPVKFSFDAAPAAQPIRSKDNRSQLLITLWLSLLQTGSIAMCTLTLTPNNLGWDKVPLLESYLIFGQLPQLVIFLLLAPPLTFFRSISKLRGGATKSKMD